MMARVKNSELVAAGAVVAMSIWFGGCGRSRATTEQSQEKQAVKKGPIEPGPEARKAIQRALIAAKPGDVIELAAGKFDLNGTISLDVKDVTIRGQGHDKTNLDFSRQEAGTGGEGVLVTAGPITIEDLAIENARGDALKVTGADGVTIRRVRTEWTGGPDAKNGSYGIYPVSCKNVLVEHCVAIGASDAGIYVGQSENIVVRHNRAKHNVAGIEIENSINADVYENHTSNNAGGILIFSLPNLPAGNGRGCRVFKNEIVDNNHENFAPAGNIVAMVPPGTGLMIMAYDDVEVFENTFKDNGTVNLSILSYLVTKKKYEDPKYDPYAERIAIHHNKFTGGGDKPAGEMGKQLSLLVGGTFPDIAYDGIVDEKKLVEGKLPDALRILIYDNGDADFANLDLANFDPLRFKFPKVSRDLAPHDGSRTALRPVELNRVQ
jgi:parallel beta-helix repeat protein